MTQNISKNNRQIKNAISSEDKNQRLQEFSLVDVHVSLQTTEWNTHEHQ